MEKIFISFDYEGMGGVCNWQQANGDARYNRLITEQVNAFLEGYFTRNPETEAVICDSHSDGNNIIYEELIGNTRLISGYPRHHYMMEGLDGSFSGVVFLGYHAPVGTMGNMDHTYSSGSIYRITINGKEASEATINTLMAAYYNVPLLFIYTDDVGAQWMHQNLCPDIPILISKKVISRYSAEFLPWESLLTGLTKAGENLLDYQGYLMPVPDNIKLELELADTNIGYALQMIPGVERINDRKVMIECQDVLIMYKYLMTCVHVAGSVRNLYK